MVAWDCHNTSLYVRVSALHQQWLSQRSILFPSKSVRPSSVGPSFFGQSLSLSLSLSPRHQFVHIPSVRPFSVSPSRFSLSPRLSPSPRLRSVLFLSVGQTSVCPFSVGLPDFSLSFFRSSRPALRVDRCSLCVRQRQLFFSLCASAPKKPASSTSRFSRTCP